MAASTLYRPPTAPGVYLRRLKAITAAAHKLAKIIYNMLRHGAEYMEAGQQYFEKENLGNCSYRENNLKFSHGAAIIPEEDATKDVNVKVTVANVTGEKNNVFL